MERGAVLVFAVWALACGGCSLLQKPAPADAGPPHSQLPVAATTEEPPSSLPALEGGAPGPGGHPSFPGHPHSGGSCAGNLVPIRIAGTGAPECVLECASDAACPEGTICDAKGTLEESGKAGKTVSYCAVGKRAPGKTDAGAPGPTPSAPSTPGTPATPVSPPKHLDVRKGANGACPAGYLACGAACRLSCKSASDCEVTGARCVSGMCEGPGALPCK
jgi:hypothetical protein